MERCDHFYRPYHLHPLTWERGCLRLGFDFGQSPKPASSIWRGVELHSLGRLWKFLWDDAARRRRPGRVQGQFSATVMGNAPGLGKNVVGSLVVANVSLSHSNPPSNTAYFALPPIQHALSFILGRTGRRPRRLTRGQDVIGHEVRRGLLQGKLEGADGRGVLRVSSRSLHLPRSTSCRCRFQITSGLDFDAPCPFPDLSDPFSFPRQYKADTVVGRHPDEGADMGHGGPGELPPDSLHVLQERGRDHVSSSLAAV